MLIQLGATGFLAIALVVLAWPVAAGLALVALVLAFWRSRRRASKRWAIASMMASAPIGLAHLILLFPEPRNLLDSEYWLLLFITFAPLMVAAVVYRSDRRYLKGMESIRESSPP